MDKIYILKLENCKYYVGKARNIENKYKEHLNGIASEWTKIHRPITIIEEVSNAPYLCEDKYVFKYMSKYGIENVRGGSYTSVVLDDITLIALQKELYSRCGIKISFSKECSAVDMVDTTSTTSTTDTVEKADDSDSSSSSYEYIVWYCEFCNREFDTKYSAIKHEDNCYKKTTYYMK
jgi:predicted GIY-YIG superfamily endonuclease